MSDAALRAPVHIRLRSRTCPAKLRLDGGKGGVRWKGTDAEPRASDEPREGGASVADVHSSLALLVERMDDFQAQQGALQAVVVHLVQHTEAFQVLLGAMDELGSFDLQLRKLAAHVGTVASRVSTAGRDIAAPGGACHVHIAEEVVGEEPMLQRHSLDIQSLKSQIRLLEKRKSDKRPRRRGEEERRQRPQERPQAPAVAVPFVPLSRVAKQEPAPWVTDASGDMRVILAPNGSTLETSGVAAGGAGGGETGGSDDDSYDDEDDTEDDDETDDSREDSADDDDDSRDFKDGRDVGADDDGDTEASTRRFVAELESFLSQSGPIAADDQSR